MGISLLPLVADRSFYYRDSAARRGATAGHRARTLPRARTRFIRARQPCPPPVSSRGGLIGRLRARERGLISRNDEIVGNAVVRGAKSRVRHSRRVFADFTLIPRQYGDEDTSGYLAFDRRRNAVRPRGAATAWRTRVD